MMNTGTEGMGFAGVDVAKYASNPSIPPPLTAGDALGPDHRTFVARTRLEEPWIIDFDEVDGVPDFVELEGRTS
ncbi:MAG: hypothetical protein H6817_02590 [Phycisphaerales bacterium]|nr:hypothetical protein [Phycisphaerales bacterium]